MQPIDPRLTGFTDVARRLVPAGAFTAWGGDGGRLVIQVAWPVPDAPPGEPRFSAPVHVVVTREAVEDFVAAPAVRQQAAEKHFEEWLRKRAAGHEPAPVQVIGGPRPPEWTAGPFDLFPIGR